MIYTATQCTILGMSYDHMYTHRYTNTQHTCRSQISSSVQPRVLQRSLHRLVSLNVWPAWHWGEHLALHDRIFRLRVTKTALSVGMLGFSEPGLRPPKHFLPQCKAAVMDYTHSCLLSIHIQCRWCHIDIASDAQTKSSNWSLECQNLQLRRTVISCCLLPLLLSIDSSALLVRALLTAVCLL